MWGPKATALVWKNEINILEKYKDHPYLDKIIEHEKKHIKFFKQYEKLRNEGKHFKAELISQKNNIWDMFDCYRLDYYFDKNGFIGAAICFGAMATVFLFLFIRQLLR